MAVNERYQAELREITRILQAIDVERHRTKESKEKTMPGKMLFSPSSLNEEIAEAFFQSGWSKQRVYCDYPTEYYTDGYAPAQVSKGAFREIDFVKHRLGVEVQFGKYSFMVYNVCAKMTIFHHMDIIDVGVEIVPVKELAEDMSSGVSYFEQFVWDLERRGVADIDIPVLILGLAP